jgi:hypothetical protein
MATAASTTVLITGNTYPVKDTLKAMGGRWDAEAKGWRVPAAKADAAKALVTGDKKSSGSYHPTKCRICGRVAGSRSGYFVHHIGRDGLCNQCRIDEREARYDD